MFDALMGMYNYYDEAVKSEYTKLHFFLMMTHIYIANIFMLNYLIAILASVYEDMLEKGEFAFKCVKYNFIERYMIAFTDEWGYSELCIHAPPLNICLILLIPSLFNREKMLKNATKYSKFFFWFDNMFYILFQLIYELYLVPVVFIKAFVNVIKLEGFGFPGTRANSRQEGFCCQQGPPVLCTARAPTNMQR